VHELQRHYSTHYAKVQNLVINGLDAGEGILHRNSTIVYPHDTEHIVEALLSAGGIDDARNAALISKVHKALLVV
jgi:hypothetical protein